MLGIHIKEDRKPIKVILVMTRKNSRGFILKSSKKREYRNW